MKLSLLYQDKDQGAAFEMRADRSPARASCSDGVAPRCPAPGTRLPPRGRQTDDGSRHLHQLQPLDGAERRAVKLSLAIAAIVFGAALTIVIIQTYAAGAIGEEYARALSE